MPRKCSSDYMATGSFTSDIRYKKVRLWRPSDVVQHSFIVQNSISQLDLEVRPSYRFSAHLRCYNSIFSPNSVINTEEKCQRIYSKSRNLLYNLHLDLPKAREWSLKNESFPKHCEEFYDSPCVARIEIDDEFYIDRMRFMIHYLYTYPSCMSLYRRDNVLKWFMKVDELKSFDRIYMPPIVLKHIVDCMYNEFTDLEFVKNCLDKIIFADMLKANDKPERVKSLLYLVHREGGRFDRKTWRCEFSDRCFLHPSFAYVGEILKFMNAPHLCQSFLQSLQTGNIQIRYNNPFGSTQEPLRKKRRTNNDRRHALLLHLYWTYLNKASNPSAASESLWLVWNAVPDPFISYYEIMVQFNLNPEGIADVYDFYSKAVGENHKFLEPRSLKHLCRSTVRYRLWKSEQWFPLGIEKLKIHSTLKSYLRLEK